MDSLSTPKRYQDLRSYLLIALLLAGMISNAQSAISRVWINMANEQNTGNQILVGYTDMTTMDVDPGFDAPLVQAGDCLSSLIGTARFVIQARAPFEASDIVPLALHAENAGTFTIWIDQADGVFADGQSVFLYDNDEKKLSDLSSGAYSFDTEPGDFDNRFQLVYQAQTLGLESLSENGFRVYTEDGRLTVDIGAGRADEIRVFDLAGRQLTSVRQPSGTVIPLNGLIAQQQLRLVWITLASGRTVVRKVVF